MSKYSNASELASLTLGQDTQYNHQYDAKLLQPVPRSLNRDDLNLGDTLPFHGCDIWTLYELSWLNTKGLPQVAIADVVVPATSPNLIESKSFKLYLNSLNQTQFEHWQSVAETIEKDLSQCAGEAVQVQLHKISEYTGQAIEDFSISNTNDQPIETKCIDEQDIEILDYQFNPELLRDCTSDVVVHEKLYSHLLKSNCLITNQPDWGSIEIHYSGKQINPQALLRYIVSFREHNEFHEQCVERIFTDITQYCQPDTLTVYARYTRRGGLDINPYRSSEQSMPTKNRRFARQ